MQDLTQGSSAPSSVLPSFTSLFKEAVTWWKPRAGTFVLYILSGVLLAVVPIAILFGSIASYAMSVFLEKEPMAGVGFALAAVVALCALLLIAGSIVWQIGLVHLSFEKDLGVRSAWKKGLNARVFSRYFFGGILWTILLAFGFVFFIIPGIYLLVPVYLWTYVVVREDKGIIDGILYSMQLARGFWWTLFVRFGWLLLLTFAVDACVRTLSVVFIMGVGSVDAMIGLMLGGIVSFAGTLIMAFVISPVSMVFCRMAYERVAEAKALSRTASQSARKEVGQIVGIIILAILLTVGIGALSSIQEEAPKDLLLGQPNAPLAPLMTPDDFLVPEEF